MFLVCYIIFHSEVVVFSSRDLCLLNPPYFVFKFLCNVSEIILIFVIPFVKEKKCVWIIGIRLNKKSIQKRRNGILRLNVLTCLHYYNDNNNYNRMLIDYNILFRHTYSISTGCVVMNKYYVAHGDGNARRYVRIYLFFWRPLVVRNISVDSVRRPEPYKKF